MYKKGKDIKVPFDCLWHCMTRSFQAVHYSSDNDGEITATSRTDKPEGFEKW